MGGNAIKIAERVPRERFFEYIKDVIPRVKSAFKTEVSMVNGFHNKQDFGDLDLLVLRAILEEHFAPDEININTHVVSFNYNELQVDLIFTPIENWETSKVFFEWGDLGNFIGKMTNNYGRLRDHGFSLKYGYDGFKCKLLHNGKYKNIYLTKRNEDVFDFLGLDYDRWKLGFDERESMFDYVIGSKYFDYPSFQWVNLNSINKDRNKRRPNYVNFLEYIENHKTVITWDKGYEFYLNEVKDFFDVDLLEELNTFKDELRKEEIIKSKFNGKIIMEAYPNLRGKDLGKAIFDFKSQFTDWEDFVCSNSSEIIMEKFSGFMN
jgi:hypothetical protein